jgi:hypothetical protein
LHAVTAFEYKVLLVIQMQGYVMLLHASLLPMREYETGILRPEELHTPVSRLLEMRK